MIYKIRNRFYQIFQRVFLYYKTKKDRKRLRNSDFSIISNHCMGGIIYHDLGCKFLSCTINLKILPDDFVEFLSHLQYYLNREIIPAFEMKESYPVGKITKYGGNGYIYIYFVHYKSFEDAVEKWYERAKRINFDNLIIMMTARDGCSDSTLQQFEQLEYQHKVCYTLRPYENYPHCKYARLDNGKELRGYISDMVNIFGKRAFECNGFDYVAFINKAKNLNYK